MDLILSDYGIMGIQTPGVMTPCTNVSEETAGSILRVKMEAAHYTKLHRVTIQKSST
jgi:hypothetical protein